MEFFIGIAFWIIAVSSAPVSPVKPNDNILRLASEEVNCLSDSTFYAPENVMPSCFNSALECIIKELEGPVKEECKDKNNRIDQVLEILEREYKSNHTNSTECVCEVWPLTNFKEFLEKVNTLLQLANAISG